MADQDRLSAARGEAEAHPVTNIASSKYKTGFLNGAAFQQQWADDNPQPTTITRAQFRSAYSQFWIEDDPHDRQGLESMQEQFLNALGIEVEGTDEA